MRPILARFVLEARRRGLLKVATAYLIVTWLVLEIGHTLFLIFDLPHGALQFIFVLLALGFPMMLVAVWHGSLGASALQTEGVHTEAHASAPHEGPWLAVIFGGVALFVIAVAIGVRFFGMGSSGASHVTDSPAATSHQVATTPATAPAIVPPAFNPPAHSIAVLPFVNMSGDPEQEYFSDGMAEELLNSLVRISELKVVARTSAFAFKDKDMEVGDIARKLNVGAILEGSVRKSGEQVRINVKLVNAVNGYHLWSQTYNRELDDIFEVQADIAASVVRQLQGTLLDNIASPGHTPSAEAYTAYLQGNYYLDVRLNPDKAVAYYEQALQLDEHYAAAMVGLARVRVRHDTYVAEARQLIDRALALDPQLASAYTLRARIAMREDFDWAAAEVSLKRAQELEPNNPYMLGSSALLAEIRGRFDESVALYRQALERDPLFAWPHQNLGRVLLATGKLVAAEASLRKSLEINPELPGAHAGIARMHLYRKEPENALAEAQLEPDRISRLAVLAAIYHASNRKTKSDAALRELIEKHASEGSFAIARVHADRGEIDEALRWLDLAYRNRDSSLAVLLSYPSMRNLAHDPRYQAFLRKLNLPIEVGKPERHRLLCGSPREIPPPRLAA